jgi:hypothetical protein
MNEAMNSRHRKEVADAEVAVSRVRQAAKLSTALATVVPAAGLYAASYRTSLGAARLERSIESDGTTR